MKPVDIWRAKFNTFSGAWFNRARTHRHLLWRRWYTGPRACFICLNPSTADEKTNDHSVTKMMGFAENMKCGAIDLVNIFDFIATYPNDLYEHSISTLSSFRNDSVIVASAKRSKYVVCAWGNHGEFHLRARNVVKLLEKHGTRH